MQIIHEHAQKETKKPLIALTDHQTRGTGRAGRVWMDAPQSSLLFSMLVHIPPQTIATFSDLVALTLCQTLREETGLSSIKIKYPNDLVVDNKKLGGILVKNIYDSQLNYLGTNAGIGINIHYTKKMLREIPTDYPATSLDISANSFLNRQKLLLKILNALKYLPTEVVAITANPNAAEPFQKKWREASSMLGKKIAILKQEQILEQGIVVGTAIGRGIELQTTTDRKWISLFDSDMKVRIRI